MSANLLLIDDDDALKELLELFLPAEGFGVERVRTGPEALERFRRGPVPDVVLIDLVLPGMSGQEVLEHMRSTVGWERTPAVIITAMLDPELPADLDPATCRVLHKPFESQQLGDLLKDLVRRKDTN